MMAFPEKGSIYRNRLSDEQDQILFFVLFIAGSASILLLKGLDAHQGVTTAVPVLLLVLYGFITWRTRRYRLRGDRIGDNMYYLGFLYTLVSLAHALYSYNVNVEDSGVEQIITNFGIAIATTIVGLAGRVLFAQMRADPVEYEQEARYSLAEALNSMRSQLGEIVTEASIFKWKLFQVIEEGVAEATGEVQTTLQKNVEKFGETSGMIVAKIDEAYTQLAKHSSELNRIAGESAAVLENFLDRIKRIDVSPEMLQAQFAPVSKALTDAAERSERLTHTQADALRRVQEFIKVSETSTEELQRNAKGTLSTIGELLGAATAKIESAGSAAELLTKSLSQTHEVISGGVGQGGEPKEGLMSVFDKTLRISLDSHRSTMENVNKAIKKDLEIATRHRREVEAILAESKRSLRETEYLMLSLARLLTEKVGAR